MSVSDELLCSFELLKPLDSTALKNHIKKERNKRNLINSPVSVVPHPDYVFVRDTLTRTWTDSRLPSWGRRACSSEISIHQGI